MPSRWLQTLVFALKAKTFLTGLGVLRRKVEAYDAVVSPAEDCRPFDFQMIHKPIVVRFGSVGAATTTAAVDENNFVIR